MCKQAVGIKTAAMLLLYDVMQLLFISADVQDMGLFPW
jgi:hypothetical protein